MRCTATSAALSLFGTRDMLLGMLQQLGALHTDRISESSETLLNCFGKSAGQNLAQEGTQSVSTECCPVQLRTLLSNA